MRSTDHSVASVQPLVIKKLLFFLSFFVVFYLIASVVRRFADVEFVTRALVGGAAVVAVFALVERNTGYDVFNHLQSVLPFLHLNSHNVPSIPSRGGRLRVYASAQHPIALGAALAMLVPFAVYLAKRSGRYWWIAAGLLVLGSLATGSRTGVVVLLVIVLSYLLLGRITVGQLWPALIPALLVIHFATPGSLGTLRSAFFPKGGHRRSADERRGRQRASRHTLACASHRVQSRPDRRRRVRDPHHDS